VTASTSGVTETDDCFCGQSESELIRETIRGGKQRDIVRCNGCGAARKASFDVESHRILHEENEQVDEIDLDALSESYRERTLVDVKRRIETIIPFLDDTETLLDFGTGMGHFLERIDRRVTTAVGSEINEERLQFVSEELGFPVYEGTATLLETFEAGHFDIVTMFHTLEHLPAPVEQLRAVRRLIAEDGRLFVEVPNYRDWLLQISDAYANFYYQDAHAYYFTPTSLELVLSMANFEAEIDGVQRYSLRNALHWILKGKPELESPSRYRDRWQEPLDKFYATLLRTLGRCDTLWAVAKPV